MAADPHSAVGREKGFFLHGDDLGELARLLQAHTALHQCSDMQVRSALEFMQQRGYRIIMPVSTNIG